MQNRGTTMSIDISTSNESVITALNNKSDIDLGNTILDPTISENNNKPVSGASVYKEIVKLIDSAPETLDTLNKLSQAINNDPNFATTINNSLNLKANDTTVVHNAGNESIDGIKTFTNSLIISNKEGKISALGFRDNDVILGTPPNEDSSSTIYFLDNDPTSANSNNSIGVIRGVYTSDGSTEISLNAHEPIKNSTNASTLKVVYTNNNESYAIAPSTRDEPNNNEIVTVNYLRNNLLDNNTIVKNSNNQFIVKDIAINGDETDLASKRGQIGLPSIIPSPIDFNTLTKCGIYLIYNEVIINCTNAPDTKGGIVFVYGVANSIVQEYKSYNKNAKIKIRSSSNTEESQWSDWFGIISSQTIGDGITINNDIISVPEYEGATVDTSATSGLVPPATSEEYTNFLRGDGSWQPIDLENYVTKTELDNLSKGSMPIGSIYVQYPNQLDPTTLFGGTWNNISSTFAGKFTRIEGGNSASFGNSQSDGLPEIHGESIGYGGKGMFNSLTGAFYSGYSSSSIRSDGQGSANQMYFSASLYNSKYGSSDEVRPENITVRVWQRTK